MLKLRTVSCLVIALLLTFLASVYPAQAEAAANLHDISGHWAQSQIENLVGQGVISGNPDGSFKPDNSVTRAEFIVMTNRAFSFNNTVTINYTDVKAGDWFAPDIAKAVAAGYTVGSNGMMNPDQFITRAEAATMLAQAAKLDTAAGADSLAKFKDAASIPVWSQNFVAAVVKAGYMNGNPDGTFAASDFTTKAMAAVMLNQAMQAKATVYNQAGTYGPQTGSTTIDGDVSVITSGVILQNTIITGNLLIAKSVGDGDVTLKNVTVKGNTYINGGGPHSITADGSNLGNVTSNQPGVHIVCMNGTTVVSLTLANGATVEVASGSSVEGVTVSATGAVSLTGDFGDITVEGDNATVAVNGNVDNLNVPTGTNNAAITVNGNLGSTTVANGATDTTINLTSTGGSMNVEDGALHTTVNVIGGTLGSLTVATGATDTTINIAGGATVTTLTANAAASVTGTGTITAAIINAPNVTIDQTPAQVTAAPGVTYSAGGQTQTGTGETVTSPTTPPGGGGGGGGGDTTPPSIASIETLNLNNNYTSGATTITVSKINDNPIGSVTITFSEAIKKASKDDITLRVYSASDATGLLSIDVPTTTIIKGMLFSKFGTGDSTQLQGTINSSYTVLCAAMNLLAGDTVRSIQVDVFDLAGNKLTITLNISQP